MAKRKQDESVGSSDCEKLKSPMSLRALRQAAGLMPGAGFPSSVQDVPLAPPAFEALAANVVVTVTSAPPPPLVVPVQEATPTVDVNMSTTSASPVVVTSSTIIAPLLSVGMATASAPVMSPPPSLAPSVPSSTILVMASPPLSSWPHVSLDHMYTSNNVHSLWAASYRPKQKTPTGFVSTFDKN